MKRQKFAISMALSILMITVFISATGFLSMSVFLNGRVPPDIRVGHTDIGGLNKQEAVQKIEESYENTIKDDFINISYNTGNINKDFRVKFSDIDASIQYKETVDAAFSQKGAGFERLINGFFVAKKTESPLQINFNNDKLKDKLSELADIIDRKCKDANIYLLNGKLTKEPGENGISLNIDNSIEKIKNSLAQDLSKPINFDVKNNYEINVEPPYFTSDELKDMDDVIATYSTDISGYDNEKSIKLAAKAINKVWLNGIKSKYDKPVEFSFNNYLDKVNGIVEENNEGYNQVASTLYAALLLTDIDKSGISRSSHKSSVDYIEPGLDTVVFGRTVDFKFVNNSSDPIMIFCSVKDNKVYVSIAGKKKDNSIVKKIKVDIEDKYPPSVVHVESPDLETGETKIISKGREGARVKVSVQSEKDGIILEKKELYTQSYKPDDEIVQVRGETSPENSDSK